MEHPSPKPCPTVAGPHVECLIITQWPDQPTWQGQQWCRVKDGVVNGYFIAFQHTRQYLSTQRKPVGAIQMAVKVLLNVCNHLRGLVINGGEACLFAQSETIHFNRDDSETLFQQADKWQKYLVRYPQSGNEQQCRGFFFAESNPIHNGCKGTLFLTKRQAKPPQRKETFTAAK